MATLNGVLVPDNIVVGLNVSYTVPAGKVALVRATLSATNVGSVTSNYGSTSEYPAVTGNSSTGNVDLTLRAGDIISSVRTTGTGSTNNTSNVMASRVASCTTVMTVNGSNACSVNASASASNHNTSPGAGVVTNTTTGVADFGFFAEEYFA